LNLYQNFPKEDIMKERFALLFLVLFIMPVLFSLPADASVSISFPVAFVDRFPGNAQHLGFDKGNLLAVGAFVISDVPINSVTATNLSSGLVLSATAPDAGPIFSALYQVLPLPPFNAEEHAGVWEIRAEAEDGSWATALTHNLNKEAIMPYVKDIRAFGDPYTPTIVWREPDEKFIPDGCILQHRLRLLTSGNDQFYRSGPIAAYPPGHTIPGDILNEENFYDTWVRVEFSCLDIDDLIHPVAAELRSETFRPLSDMLIEGASR
jgi:hypothetical protein